jgi:hypothetical protein
LTPTVTAVDDPQQGNVTALQQPAGAPPAAADSPLFAAASDSSGRAISFDPVRRAISERKARDQQLSESEPFAALRRCFPRWRTVSGALSWDALSSLATGEPVDPNSPDTWQSAAGHIEAILRRYGIRDLRPDRLTDSTRSALTKAQQRRDRRAGIDWLAVRGPSGELDKQLRRAQRKLPIDLANPETWAYTQDRRAALCAIHDLDDVEAGDLSPLVIDEPGSFDRHQLTSWRLASASWLEVARSIVATPTHVARPVGLMVCPSVRGGGWTLQPALSLAMIMLVDSLEGEIDSNLTGFHIPLRSEADVRDFLERINQATLTAKAEKKHETDAAHTQAASRRLGLALSTGNVSKLDEWGRLQVRQAERGVWAFRIETRSTRTFKRKRLGSHQADKPANERLTTSLPMDLGEAVGVAQDTGLPLLLSSEAGGQLNGLVRVGRSRGRPGVLSITTADGISATTERLPVERSLGRLRKLKTEPEQEVIVDAGAAQLIRMATVKPLSDDTVLLPPQRRPTAIMVVGSGVNASDVGTGKTIMAGRALAHRASATVALRSILVARGRLLRQWRRELQRGDGPRMPPLAPNVHLHTIDEETSVAAQVRSFHRRLGERPGMLLVPEGVLERHVKALQVINYHLLLVEEAHNYLNPTLDLHGAVMDLRVNSVADCWLLTATPRGKESTDIDILEGIAMGDRQMVAERTATREAGSLLNETNAHRVRIGYGPTFLRVPYKAVERWMPKVRPAKAVPVEADPALARLLKEIRDGGRESYRELLRMLGELKQMEHGSELYEAAQLEIARVRGRVLSNVGVFLDASVDPETLRYSRAVLAQALVRDGLVTPAVEAGGRGEPTLRAIVADTLASISGRADQVLVFAQRLRCLHQLAGSLGDRGVDCRVAHGRLSDDEFEEMKEAFHAGEFTVMCVGEIAQEGHNLQCAKHLFQLDLGWLPKSLQQRVGRGARIGARHPELHSWIAYIRGAAIPYQVGVLAPRGAENHQFLDGFEGVPAEDSPIAGQLAEITGQVAEAKRQEGFELSAAKLRFAAGVFGY